GQPVATGPVIASEPPRPPGTPSPVLAGLLGFIPGVGAMYNGQFKKAFVHVGIFVCLVIATNSIGPIGILIGFWVLYMAFDAYKTAVARGRGFTAPDLFGWDKTFGLQDTQHPPAAPTGESTTNVAPSVVAPPVAPPPVQIAPPPPPQETAPVGAIVLIALG